MLSFHLLQSDAVPGLPSPQTSCVLPLGVHLGSGPEAVRQHPLPAAPGPEDRLLLPEERQCLAQGRSAAALGHLLGPGERGLHAAVSPRVKASNGRHVDADVENHSNPELLIQVFTAALSPHPAHARSVQVVQRRGSDLASFCY